GERLTVMRRAGSSKPLLRIALRTRSRASCTWLPARPTMVSAGRPKATSTSTRTGTPSTPTIDALSVSASTAPPIGRPFGSGTDRSKTSAPAAHLLASQLPPAAGSERLGGEHYLGVRQPYSSGAGETNPH